MADPITLALIGASLGGTIIGALSKDKEGEERARLAEREAKLQRLQADEVLNRAKINVKALKRQKRQVISQQISAVGASGVDISGSPLDLLEDTAEQVRLEVHNIKTEAKFRAKQIRKGAALTASSAGGFRKAGKLGALSTLLGGGVQAGLAAKTAFSSPSTGPSPATRSG